MNIVIGFNLISFIDELFGVNFYYLIRQIFILIIVIFVLWVIFRIFRQQWLAWVQEKYLAEQKYILLGIDVPRDNQQGPEAIERFFASLYGIKIKVNWYEKYFLGKSQLDISLEIASFNGQIQYFVYTPVQYRDLVESAIYATYPGVEIYEVEDYTKNAPEEFPNDKYDLWGADLGLYNKNPYPIKTYPYFEHGLTKELKDPIIGLLEILGKLQKGEQVWIQFIIRPAGSDFNREGQKIVKELLGGKVESKKTWLDKTLQAPVKISQGISDIIVDALGLPLSAGSEKEKKESAPNLSPGEKKVIESIQNKIAKLAFETRIRIIYVAEKEVFTKDRGVIGVLSAFNAVSTLDMNGLEPEKRMAVSSKRLLKLQAQKTAIRKAFQKRACYWRAEAYGLSKIFRSVAKFLTINIGPKKKKNILNIEELATLYHFPVLTAKPPLIKKTGSKKAEPPFGLPMKY